VEANVTALFIVALMMHLAEDQQTENGGSIVGVVLNGSNNWKPIAGAEVVLRAGVDGLLDTVASTKTDLYGKYRFSSLPLDRDIVYLPGVNREGIHYPGHRVQLNERNWIEHVQVLAYDATSASPLALQRHDIDIDVEDGVLCVNETLWVVNQSRVTFVGPLNHEGGPTTLRLAVPKSFDRVTFEREHYGRRFRVVDGGLATDMPWPPGSYKLAFKYRLPLGEIRGTLRRSLDLACAQVNVRIKEQHADRVVCNLPASSQQGDAVRFSNPTGVLASGFVVEVTISGLPLSWAFYSRTGALAAVGILIVATLLRSRRRKNCLTHSADAARAPATRQCFDASGRKLSA
jgi:hypothetical protein